MKKIISFLLMLLALTSCSDQLNENGSSTSSDIDGLEGGGITLTISLPDFSKEELTRAGDTGLTSLNVVAYDKDGKFLSNESVTGWDIVENGYKVKVPVVSNASMIHLVANAASLTDEQCQNGLDKAVVSGTISTENPLCWGRISVSALMGTNPSVTLLRQFGKVSVQGPTTNSSSEFIEKKLLPWKAINFTGLLVAEPLLLQRITGTLQHGKSPLRRCLQVSAMTTPVATLRQTI